MSLQLDLLSGRTQRVFARLPVEQTNPAMHLHACLELYIPPVDSPTNSQSLWRTTTTKFRGNQSLIMSIDLFFLGDPNFDVLAIHQF